MTHLRSLGRARTAAPSSLFFYPSVRARGSKPLYIKPRRAGKIGNNGRYLQKCGPQGYKSHKKYIFFVVDQKVRSFPTKRCVENIDSLGYQ